MIEVCFTDYKGREVTRRYDTVKDMNDGLWREVQKIEITRHCIPTKDKRLNNLYCKRALAILDMMDKYDPPFTAEQEKQEQERIFNQYTGRGSDSAAGNRIEFPEMYNR